MKNPMPLAWIPNVQNFRFRGIKKDGSRITCLVKKDETGCHTAIHETTGERVFTQLESWEKI